MCDRLAKVKNKVTEKLFPVIRSASIKPVNAPSHPPIFLSVVNLKKSPSKTAFAGQKIARKESGLPNIPAKAQANMITAIRKNAEILSLNV